MASCKVPLVAQWNLMNGCMTTPDGSGFLYVGSRSINFIGRIVQGQAPVIKAFPTRQSILGVDIDPAWRESSATTVTEDGGVATQDQRYFAILALDNSIQIWDFDRGVAVSGHKAHFNVANYKDGGGGGGGGAGGPLSHFDRVLMGYLSNRNVLSIDGRDIVVYCVTSNTYCRRPSVLPARNHQFTMIRCSPFNEHTFAVGSNRGLVLVCDLLQMRVLYTLRGHDAAITALSWTLASARNAAAATQMIKAEPPKAPKITKAPALSTNDDIFDIYDYDYLENEFGAPCNASADKSDQDGISLAEALPPSDLVHPPLDSDTAAGKFDFVEACQNLKHDLDARRAVVDGHASDDSDYVAAVTLADCQKAKTRHPLEPASSVESAASDESIEGSLELIEGEGASSASSDEGVDVDGSQRQPHQQILTHQAEVHATQTLEHIATPIATKAADTESPLYAISTDVIEETGPFKQRSPANELDKPDVLLASASVDGNFWIWNASTGAACDNFKAHAGHGGVSAGGSSSHGKNTHIEAAWLPGVQLLTTNKQGNLSLWSLKRTEVPQQTPHNLRYKFKEEKRNFAQRSVVALSIAAVVETTTKANNNSESSTAMLWCITSNREITCEEIAHDQEKQTQLLAKFSCASTGITAMRECPDDMNKIALALSDRRVGILDISKMSQHNVQIENFGLRIDAPVLALAWSPDNRRLAFATNEGRVGILNVENPKQQPHLLNPVCGKAIYSMDWQAKELFVVCNDNLAIYQDDAKNRDAHVVRGIQNVTAVAVRHGHVFVGTKRGRLQIYKRANATHPDGGGNSWRLDLLQEVEVAARYITEIAWSPIEPRRFAVAANDNKLKVLEFRGPGDGDAESGRAHMVHSIVMKGGKAATACVKWSNQNEWRLLTCGFDGCVRVWDFSNSDDAEDALNGAAASNRAEKRSAADVTAGEQLPDNQVSGPRPSTHTEKYLEKFPCPMLCGLFLPTDEAILLCAGKTTSVEFVDTRCERNESGPVGPVGMWGATSGAQHGLDSVQWATKVVAPGQAGVEKKSRRGIRSEQRRIRQSQALAGVEVVANGSEQAPSSKGEPANMTASGGAAVVVQPSEHQLVEALDELHLLEEGNVQSPLVTGGVETKMAVKCGEFCGTAFFKTPVTLLHLTAKELNKEAVGQLQAICQRRQGAQGVAPNDCLCGKLFGTKAQAQQLLAQELRNHEHSEVRGGIATLFLPQLNSGLKAEVLRSIQTKTLTAWHVSLAPSLSYSFWQKCAQAYADQLLESGHALQAASYLLALHKQYDVIEMLLRQQYFKEALLLGRVYLQPEEPLLRQAVGQWIDYLEFTGNLVGAAYICMLAGKLRLAADTLAKVRNPAPEVEHVLRDLQARVALEK